MTAEAPSSPPEAGLAEPRPRRDWLSLAAELPYFAIVVIGLLGICWADIFRVPRTTYWVAVTPVIALLCVAVGWRHTRKGERIAMIVTQVAQWAAVLIAMYLMVVTDVRGLLNTDAIGLMLMTLLALGVFISGLYLRSWKLGVTGVFLAVSVPTLAWIEEAALVLFFAGAVLIGLGLLLWWGRAKLAS
jgi:hypothetical protein